MGSVGIRRIDYAGRAPSHYRSIKRFGLHYGKSSPVL